MTELSTFQAPADDPRSSNSDPTEHAQPEVCVHAAGLSGAYFWVSVVLPFEWL